MNRISPRIKSRKATCLAVVMLLGLTGKIKQPVPFSPFSLRSPEGLKSIAETAAGKIRVSQ